MYKSRLQELCHERQWALPRYTSMKDGPDHNPCFKASVFLNGMCFHSSVSCKSSKEAQNEAAKSACFQFASSSSSFYSSATPNPLQQVDLGFYKNLLQELSQKHGLSIPEYNTRKCGLPHKATFFSTVEVDREVFHGNGGKSKKEAEINAAKIAYTNLTQRLLVKSPELSSSECLASKPLKSMSTSVLTTTVENEELAEDTVEKEELAEENEVEAGEKVLANSTISPESSASCSKLMPVSPKEGLKGRSSEFYSLNQVTGGTLKSKSSSDLATAEDDEEHAEEEELQEMKAVGKAVAAINATTRTSPEEGSMSSLDISALSISDSSMEKKPGLRSYLLNNRFRVYSSFPDIAFPEGITVLPISEDKWVAVSLEFPNEREA